MTSTSEPGLSPKLVSPLSVIVSVVVMSAAFATRGAQSLAYDELFTIWVASRPFADVIHQANVDGFTPPLFYLLVKALASAGLANEDLRLLPIVFAGLAISFGIGASVRLFGLASRWRAAGVIGGSAYLFTFAHELRPYSALLACSFFYLGQMGEPRDRRGDLKAAIAALIATALSYLGVGLVLAWLYECRRRVPRPYVAAVAIGTLVLCAPGLLKIAALTAASQNSSITWTGTTPAFPGMLLGLGSLPFPRAVGVACLILLVLTLIVAHRTRSLAGFPFLLRTLLILAATLLLLDGAVRIGFAPRYWALILSVLLLLIVGALSRIGRVGLSMALLILGLNGVAISRYLWVAPAPRENWRMAIHRLDERLGAEGVVLAFPFHHAAVAAHAYAPRLKVGGGYTSRSGPVYWYEPPTDFTGYSFTGLKKFPDAREMLSRLADASDLCLVSDEPDLSKTASVFDALEKLGSSTPLDVGDARLRVVCRSRR